MTTNTPNWFIRLAWSFWAYLVFVILFGACVRITHSGAGCGAHWPTCNGDIIPLQPSLETMIEYTHRLTSGMCGIFGLGMLGFAAKRFGIHHRVFFAQALTLIFVIFEGAIGAGLVLKELVVNDASSARAMVISIHLVNTFFLTGSAAAAAFFAGDKVPQVQFSVGLKWMFRGTGAFLIFVAMAGAVTALGDTLFPVAVTDGGGFFAHMKEDLDVTSHFLVRLRIFHPVLAVLFALVVVLTGLRVFDETKEQNLFVAKLGKALMHCTLLEVVVGGTNIMLGAPGYMQLIHLLFAQILWTLWALVFFASWKKKTA
jgi:cytochrome c oxidase assembly protein subunit 15